MSGPQHDHHNQPTGRRITEYDSDQKGLLPYSELGLWFSNGYIWIDTQDGTTHPYRVTQLGEADQWATLDEAVAEQLTPLTLAPPTGASPR